MASTIKIKNSSTASAVPTSSDLVQGELAVNVTDKRIFTENASGTVVELGTNPSTLAVAGTTTLSGNQIVSVTDNTNAALRITQLGTGNALLVEDSSNPDATPFVIDANGRVVIGATTNDNTSTVNAILQLQATSGAAASFSQYTWANSSTSAPFHILNKSNGAAVGTRGSVASGDLLGAVYFNGDDGTNFIRAASISAAVDGTPGTNDMPGRLVFSTTADGASSPTERVRIASDGLVSLQNSSGLSIARTAVTSPASTDGNVFSGTYTPTLTNVVNVASSTAHSCQYMRVGKVVTVSGRVTITATATGAIQLGMTLPIASAFTLAAHVGGSFSTPTATETNAGCITADVTNDRFDFYRTAQTTGSINYYFTVTYQVL